MLFNTLQFAVFFLAILGLYRSLPAPARNALLLATSLLFYVLWIPAYLPLILIDIGVNYALLRGMRRSPRPGLLLGLSVGFTLALLAYFKYAAMIVTSALPLLEGGLGLDVSIPEILLPLGISFYSFQIIAFSVDSYRHPERELPRLGRYALFVCFFPQLIAGPILRGNEFLPQLANRGQMNAERTRRGLWLIASGIAKKVVMADFLLAPYVDAVFSAPGVASAPFHLVAMYCFTFQIYFDFSGYTDMGRGMALLLGYELPMNFTEPFLSRNPSEVWRRWHITLSRWMQDYLYIPLGGNRHSEARTYVNLLITMLLSGLWHGAGWNFVLWGGFHGVLLAAHRRFGRRRQDIHEAITWRDAGRIAVHFHFFAFAFIAFRSESLADMARFVKALFGGGELSGWPVMQAGIVLLCAALHLAERKLRLGLPRLQGACAQRTGGLALEGLALGALLAVAVMVAGAGGEFIYFQF
ncbi:MAG: MBOAT family protein [Deltaproteobacteria bacterium]|nr:MBOAT family protein [Deltaproteobacteria bacterium]